MPFRLAHLSDCHLGPLPSPRLAQLLSKRLFGYLNWQRNRAKAFDPLITSNLIADLKAHKPDHIAVTGDMVNIGLEDEFQRAGLFLKNLAAPDAVTVIPGNHDAYVRGALERFNTHCAENLTSDPVDRPDQIYPIERRRGPVQMIGLSTAITTPPFMATGHVDTQQIARLEHLLTTSTAFRIVLIHHPPLLAEGPAYKRLTNADAIVTLLAKHGAELVLHGHTHLSSHSTLPGPNGPIPVMGVSSAAQAPTQKAAGHARPAASFTLFDIDDANDHWQVRVIRRGYPPSSGAITTLAEDLVLAPKPAALPTAKHR